MRRPSSKPAAPAASGSGSYRPALDGVRAAAVFAVIAYHVSEGMGGSAFGNTLNTLSRGGFLGVDIFFVLSGYLITTLLLRERFSTGRLRLGTFWLRRARRLLPALLLLLAVTAIATALATPALEATGRRDDMLATLFYFANWHFIATDASYFAGFLEATPLRHMWSLAIEEQFYLLWPIALLGSLYLARGRPRVLLISIVTATLASTLLMAFNYEPGFPSTAYFGTLSHAAPLLIGSGLAVLINSRPQLLSGSTPRRIAAVASPLVFALLFAVLITFDDQGALYYGGGLALFALTVAAALWIVEALPRSLPARLLSLRAVVWVGVISYGLYLWHWPVLLWIGAPEGISLGAAALIVAVTFAVAALSFYLVERPVREQRVPGIRTSRRRMVLAFAAAFLVVSLAASGAPRLSQSSALGSQVDDTSDIPCAPGSPGFNNPAPGNDWAWCQTVAPSGDDSPVIASVGDSTATALTPGLSALATERGWGYVQAGQHSCSLLPTPFLADPTDVQGIAVARACARNVSQVLRGVRRDFDPAVWIVSDHVLSFSSLTADDTPIPPGTPELDQRVTEQMTSRLNELSARGEQVVVLEILPLGPPVECAGIPSDECDFESYAEEAAHANELLREAAAAAERKPILVSVEDVVCPDGQCLVSSDETLIRPDGTHYTGSFSKTIAPEIIRRAQARGLQL